mgnify:CR=1 FL=1
MPLLNIYYCKNQYDPKSINVIRDAIHSSLVQTWQIPKRDCFQIYHEVDETHFLIDPHMWDMNRSDRTLVIHVTSMPRSTEMKLAFYQAVPVALQHAIGLDPDDIFISIITNQAEDWSFGQGKAQLVETDS